MGKEEKFEKYKGYVIKVASRLWETWDNKENSGIQYMSKEDIVQEAYIKLWEILDNIDETHTDSQIIMFVITSTKNHILNMFRNASRLKKASFVEHNNVDDIPCEDVHTNTIEQRVISEFFNHLNKTERQFVDLLLEKTPDKNILTTLKWNEKTLRGKKLKFKQILKDIQNGYK